MSKLRPILFSTAMVQAILDGRKTQTRRVVKPQPEYTRGFVGPIHWIGDKDGKEIKCRYGQPGDILWVRETFTEWSKGQYQFKAGTAFGEELGLWKPSIHMPFDAARIFLRVKSVRVERLQDISEDDACDEGIEIKASLNADAGDFNCYPRNYMVSDKDADGWPYFKEEEYVRSFQSLWQSINGPKSWEANPWVWVVEFERISREEALA